MSRKANGEGSIYKRRDGRYAGAALVELTNGTRKRIHIYGKTRQEVHNRLEEKLVQARKGVRTPERDQTLAAYLDSWLHQVVAIKNRPRTIEWYTMIVRVHIRPAIGHIRLSTLAPHHVQRMLNAELDKGASNRTVHAIRQVLRAALSRAEREELVFRNAAKLVEIPAWHRKSITPWTPEQATTFLDTTCDHRWHGAFLMLLTYGMRKGEVLGLRWRSIDFVHNRFRVDQTLQRINSELTLGPVKTDAGRRDLPLTEGVSRVLLSIYVERFNEDVPVGWEAHPHADDFVFLSATSTPVDPHNFSRTFQEIAEKAGLPRITVHHTRHTAATLLKNLGVPAKDAQLILGHAHVTTTQQLYQHGDIGRQTEALARMNTQLSTRVAVSTAVKSSYPQVKSRETHALTSGGPGGDRTLDTLLKSLLRLDSGVLSTPAHGRLRIHMHTHVFGRVAVNFAVTPPPAYVAGSHGVDDAIAVLRALRVLETTCLRRRSFPLNLIPSTPTAHQGEAQ